MKIKILCLNIWEGGLLWENIQTFIQKENPDILCLQEVFEGTEEQPQSFQSMRNIKKLLPAFHFYHSPEMCEVWSHGEGDTGNAIFSRFPITEQNTIFLHGAYERIIRDETKGFSHYPKNMQSVTVQINDKKLHVLNLHGVWGLDGGDSPERLHMSELILKEVENKQPLVLMGDFNLQPETNAIANIEGKLTNVFKGEMTTSFNMKHKANPGYATAVVDMFFTTPDIQILSKSIPEDDVSDHKPLLVTIEI